MTEERNKQKQHSNQHTQHYSNADKPAKPAQSTVVRENVSAQIGAKDYQNPTTKKPPRDEVASSWLAMVIATTISQSSTY